MVQKIKMNVFEYTLFAVFFIVHILCDECNASVSRFNDFIRIRIQESMATLSIEGHDLEILENEKKFFNSKGKGSWEFRCQEGKIRGRQIHPTSKKIIHVEVNEPLIVRSSMGFLSIDQKFYRNKVEIFSNGILCNLINVVEVEKYLDGLINSEFSSKWANEAILAQVIAARTYAYYQMDEAKRLKRNFDVENSIKDQVYEGSAKENDRSLQAVYKTRGKILIYNGAPIKAFYHSTCGGLTELPEEVWGKKYPGFKKRIHCNFCKSSPRFKWEQILQQFELEDSILKGIKNRIATKNVYSSEFPINLIQKLKDKKITKFEIYQNNLFRNSFVETIWSPGDYKFKIPTQLFREWIGFSKIRSTHFKIKKINQHEWRVEGQGNGHGVGMCQWGAKTLAEQGWSHHQILNFYYPDVMIE